MRKWIIGALAGAAIAIVSSTAHASEVECYWDALSPNTRDRVYAGYNAEGREGIPLFSLSGQETRRIMQCSGSASRAQPDADGVGFDIDIMLRAYALEAASSEILARRWGVTRSNLDEAWASLPPEGRLRARDAMWDLRDNPEALDLAAADILQAVAATGIEPQSDQPDDRETRFAHTMNYFMGRALREGAESR
jgi:hypothetical protein